LKKKRIEIIWLLLVISAVTSIIFLFIVESCNNIVRDDIGFAYIVQNKGVWGFMMDRYFTCAGRFMSFFITGVQLKSYLYFDNMLPFSILLYILNIALVSKSFKNFFRLKTFQSVLYAIIFFQLYFYTMFDHASFFWMCTKVYTLLMSLSLFAFSELLMNTPAKWNDYVNLFISFMFLGCSYEIFAPVIILLMGGTLLYKLYQSNFRIKVLLFENRKLVFSFCICLIFFLLMVIAPGNWNRMKVYTSDHLDFANFVTTVFNNCFLLMKLLFFRAHYLIVAVILLFAIFQLKEPQLKLQGNYSYTLKRILFYALIAVGLCLVSVILNTYAVGTRMYMRSFNHINLIVFLFIGFSAYELASVNVIRKISVFLLPVMLVFIITCNIFITVKSIPELRSYKVSLNNRMEQLEALRASGNTATIKLGLLDVAEYHSIDDLWKLIIPKYSTRELLKDQQLTNRIDHSFNLSFRKYNKFDFDVITDLTPDY
jgi:hypothetical protein